MGKKARNRNRARARQNEQRPAGPLLVPWKGETYKVADKLGDMPMMRFAKIAESGIDHRELAALAAMYDLLENCLDPADWARFQDHATRIKAGADEIMEITRLTYEAMTGRPTERPSASSDGPPPTAPSSEDVSSSPVTRVLERIPDGRPDLKLAVWQAAQEQQARTA